MPHDLYVEVLDFTVAKTFTKDNKARLSAAMTAAAKEALKATRLTVAKKTSKTKNYTLEGALTLTPAGKGANGKVSVQLNHEGKLYGMASGEAEASDLGLVEDLAAQVVTSVVSKRIATALKQAAADK